MKRLETVVQIAALLTCLVVMITCAVYVQATVTPDANPFSGGGIGLRSLGTTHLSGNLDLGGALTVDGDATLAGTTTMQAMTYTEAVWTGVSTFTDTVNADAGIAVDTNKFTVADTSGNVLTAGTLTVAGAAALNAGITVDTSAFTVANTSGDIATQGTLSVAGSATIATFLILSSQSITPTNGGVITPTASTIILTPATAVTPTLSACAIPGGHVTLYNANNAAIVLEDSTTLNAAAAVSLGQYDTLSLLCIGTTWYELSKSAN